jgi:hypothetical protein
MCKCIIITTNLLNCITDTHFYFNALRVEKTSLYGRFKIYSNMTCCFGFVNKRVYKSPIYNDLHALMIMTYLAVLLYPFVYKAKTTRHRKKYILFFRMILKVNVHILHVK